jgi:integrase
MGLTIKKIKDLQYSKQPKVNSATGKLAYPKEIIWDDEIKGFGVRVFTSGQKSFVYQYRTKNGIKRLADLGTFGAQTLDAARDNAKRWAGQILDGRDPLEERKKERSGDLVADLCKAYIDRHAKVNKRSWAEDERRNKLYILPALGRKQLQQVKRQDIAKLHDEIGRRQGKPYMANRVREQLSKMFELARTWGYVEESFINPARGIMDFKESERADFIKPEYLPIVKKALEREQNEVAKNLIWLYLLTGKRKSELLQAKWSNLDETTKTLKIPQTKNNETEYLSFSPQAWKVIERAKHFRVGSNPYIFPGQGTKHLVNIRKCWDRIRKDAAKHGAEGVEHVTIHGLRHTFAVYAVSLGGADLGTVRALLNQKSLRVTTVYAKYLTKAKQKAFDTQGELMAKLASQTRDKKMVKLKRAEKANQD